jgi:hypothetical protein
MQRRLLVFLLAAVSTYSQQTPKPFAYDVATIKPVQPDAPKNFAGILDTPDGIDAEFVTVPMLMKVAYGGTTFISDKQIIGAPAWASSLQHPRQDQRNRSRSASKANPRRAQASKRADVANTPRRTLQSKSSSRDQAAPSL